MMFSSIRSRVGRGAQAEAPTERQSGKLPTPPVKPAPESVRSLGPLEKEWKEKIHRQLLDVMDLSLIDTLSTDQARMHIRDISQRLMNEGSTPLSVEQRKRVVERIEDEVMGLGPL